VIARHFLWEDKARPEQKPPTDRDWTVWLYLAGRGAGKTRSCAEWLAWKAIEKPGTRTAIIARTFADARDTCAEGESGILTILRQYDQLRTWNRSLGEIILKNGSRIKLFSAEEPDRLRGPQHEYIWCDELAAWQYSDAWDQAQFGLRLGQKPQVVIATTPRPTKLLKRIMTDANTTISRGTTYDNLTNLAPTVATAILAKYEGTRLGRQELYGEIIDEVEGALWRGADIDAYRVEPSTVGLADGSRGVASLSPAPPNQLLGLSGVTSSEPANIAPASSPSKVELVRVVVAVDPAVTTGEDSDETGIVVVGKGDDGNGYVLADRTIKGSPAEWARKAIQALHDFGDIGTIVAETNQGGDMVEHTLRSIEPHIPFKKVHAKQGKRLRAEPISALYEQGRVHHVGVFSLLEEQMTSWLPDSGYSPDRLDALVHGLTELGLAKGSSADAFMRGLAPPCIRCNFPVAYDQTHCPSCGAPKGNP
jgi:phage terminase large subunit-like protein